MIYAQSVSFVTGHLKDGCRQPALEDLVAPGQTLVFYMGLVGLSDICEQLIAHGRSAANARGAGSTGTTQNQRVFTGTLETLPQLVAQHEVHAPPW